MDYVDHIRQYGHQPLTHQLLVSLLKAYKQPNDKIHKLIRDGFIMPVKKGLYVAGERLNVGKPEPFLLANHLLGPSYVSLETALAHHGLIPERVYEIASITTKASRQFETLVGKFTYTRLSVPYYTFGIQRVMLSDDQYAMMATPEKALCDKVVTTSGLLLRSKKSAEEFLIENMRMDEDRLKNLNLQAISSWIDEAPKGESLKMIVYAIENL